MVTEVAAHYEELLAQHYTWMLGPSFDALVSEQVELLDACGARVPDGADQRALDLGCGSGLQSVALAQLGYTNVIAIDSSPTLITELTDRAQRWPAIEPITADLCDGLDKISNVTTAVCMGDTITHLPDLAATRQLFVDVSETLEPTGRLILTFRDLTQPLTGLDRFIPVRSDEDRIMTCFLEDEGDAVRVHDLVHTRTDAGWQLATSSYRKLRLSPDAVAEQLRTAGFTMIRSEPGPRGMVVMTAGRA